MVLENCTTTLKNQSQNTASLQKARSTDTVPTKSFIHSTRKCHFYGGKPDGIKEILTKRNSNIKKKKKKKKG